MRFQSNSSSPHLSYEFCANLHRKPVEPWREVLIATNTEEIRMEPQRPLFPFDLCWSHVSNLTRIFGHSSLKSGIRQMDDYLWKILQHPSK